MNNTEQQIFLNLFLKPKAELSENQRSILLNLLAKVEDNLHYSKKHIYISLLEDYLSNKITTMDFVYSFMGIYEEIGSKTRTKKASDLMDYLQPSRSDLGELLAKIYGECDHFEEDNPSALFDEMQLKQYVQQLMSKL